MDQWAPEDVEAQVAFQMLAVIWNDNRNVVNPLSPAECADFQTRTTDPSIQGRLDSGALDQEAFVDIIEQP